MTGWNPQLISEIAESDDLHVAPFRADGVTTGTPTWIWSVVIDGRLFGGRTTVATPGGISPR